MGPSGFPFKNKVLLLIFFSHFQKILFKSSVKWYGAKNNGISDLEQMKYKDSSIITLAF